MPWHCTIMNYSLIHIHAYVSAARCGLYSIAGWLLLTWARTSLEVPPASACLENGAKFYLLILQVVYGVAQDLSDDESFIHPGATVTLVDKDGHSGKVQETTPSMNHFRHDTVLFAAGEGIRNPLARWRIVEPSATQKIHYTSARKRDCVDSLEVSIDESLRCPRVKRQLRGSYINPGKNRPLIHHLPRWRYLDYSLIWR